MFALGLGLFISCASEEDNVQNDLPETVVAGDSVKKEEPHPYGGWYCPDNLRGFPPVNIADWKNVPVVNGRLATLEETRNGSSLIHVDTEKYPNAKPLDMTMPKLARYFNHSSGKDEIVIVIQALNVQNDSIVGFRYLNGGNGSAWLKEVRFLSEEEIAKIPSSRFVAFTQNIQAFPAEIYEVLTSPKYSQALQDVFDKGHSLPADWKKSSKLNFIYPQRGKVTAEFGGDVFGSRYIQIDSEEGENQYVEKVFLLETQPLKSTDMQVVFGPYGGDFEVQKALITRWAQKVKELSEGE